VVNLVVKAHVVEVIDGDTFKTQYIIRLEGVDAPELSQSGGEEAKQKLESLILDKDITYEEKARDEYARIIAQVWVDSLNVNDAINDFLA
jgi:micrococcal nuclease